MSSRSSPSDRASYVTGVTIGMDGARYPRAVKARTGAKFGALALVIALAAVAATHFNAADGLASLAERRAWVADHLLAAALGYVAVYVAVSTACLPGVSALGVAGGVLFGAEAGAPIIVLAATTGATAAMLLARYVLRDMVRRKRPDFVARVDQAVSREGARWLLAARLAPFVPYFAVNFAVGLTQMPVATFAATTALGSVPLSTLYALAGARLAEAGRPADIMDLRLAVALLALSLIALRPARVAAFARRLAERAGLARVAPSD